MDPFVTTLGIRTGVAGWKLLQSKSAADFPALAKDPIVQREIAYFRKHAPEALTAKDLLSDRRLQDFALTAYGLSSQIGMTALMKKVLSSDTNDKTSFAAQMIDRRFVQVAAAFNYGVAAAPSSAAQASQAKVSIDRLFAESNFTGFSGTFGGVTVPYANLLHVTTWSGMANALQAAFRRADGNRTDISVVVDGAGLKFTDAKGRGGPSGFTWRQNSANTGGDGVVSDPFNVVTGKPAGAITGGPSVTKSSFIDQVVQKYMEAQFETVIGKSSNALREARYAQRQLPSIGSWYSVIADRPLANVVQTVLGLPSSFAMLNVDQQKRTLEKRMNIKDFQDPAKLNKLLTRYVTMSDLNTQQQSVAVTMLDSYGSGGIINLTLPGMSGGDGVSSASTAALIMSTALG